MIDLSTLPSRLAPITTQSAPITLERIGPQHCKALCESGTKAANSVKPWLGSTLCPTNPTAAKSCIEKLENARQSGYGIAYLPMYDGNCLGMGIINYIHPIHRCANLGYWIAPEASGQGLGKLVCDRLITLAKRHLNLIRLELFIEPANIASIRLAEKMGAQKEGLCRKRVFGRDAFLYSLLLESN